MTSQNTPRISGTISCVGFLLMVGSVIAGIIYLPRGIIHSIDVGRKNAWGDTISDIGTVSTLFTLGLLLCTTQYRASDSKETTRVLIFFIGSILLALSGMIISVT